VGKETGDRRQKSPLAVVRKQLEAYAKRGVFQSFSPVGDGEFRFEWLWGRPFVLRFDPAKATLTFVDVLPEVAKSSDIETEIKAFLVEAASPQRLAHRRLDPKRAIVRYTSRGGTGSLAFRIVGGDFEYGVQQAMNVVNELFLELLNLRWREYLVEHYQVSDE
jgi:hypothetical protein